MAKGGSRAHAWIRHRNRALVLAIIRRHGRASRSLIEQESSLAFPSVVQICAALIEDGMIEEKDLAPSAGGRPPALLAVRPTCGQAIGMKLENERLSTVVVDFAGGILRTATDAIDGTDPEESVRKIADAVSRTLDEAGPPPGQLFGLGIAVPGVVDAQRGVVRNSPPLGWMDVALADAVRFRTRVPTWIDNDVNVLAQDHLLFGSGQGLKNFLVVTFGRGVGLGVVVRGEVYRGAGGAASEIGHVPWTNGGPACSCGRRGCLEAYLGDDALLAAYAAATGVRPAGPEALRQLAAAGDPAAVAAYGRAADEAARVLGFLVTLFAPEAIILSGEGTQAGSVFTQALVGRWSAFAMRPQGDQARVVVDGWDNFRWARGAASLVLDHVIFPQAAREAAMRV